MKDHRIEKGEGAEKRSSVGLIEVLVNGADDIAHRFEQMVERLPYRSVGLRLDDSTVADLVRSLATATWRRVGDEVPSYGFAEELGRRYRKAGDPVGSVLLHWQILRRAIHLELADRKLRTGEGDSDLMRQMTMMNYAMDWATEAALVGYVLAGGAEAKEEG
jgi:hypothetical protein